MSTAGYIKMDGCTKIGAEQHAQEINEIWRNEYGVEYGAYASNCNQKQNIWGVRSDFLIYC